MAAKTLYLLDSAASGSNHLALQDGGSAPSTATTSTGWTVGTTGGGNYSAMDSGAERAAATFAAAILPDLSGPNNTLGDCFRSGLLSGRFAAGSWTITVPLIAVTAGGSADMRIWARVWRSADPTGADAVLLTTSVLVGTAATNLATGAAQNSVLTWSAPVFGLVAEYLFIQIALQTVGAGGGATDDALIRKGSAAAIVTADWLAADPAAYNLILDGQGLMLAPNGWKRSLSRQFATQLSPTATARRNTALIEQDDWSGGSRQIAFDSASPNRYRAGYGLDPNRQVGAIQVGPGLIASRSSSNNAARVFGLFGGQLYLGYSTGQVDRQTATDTWSAAVGTLTSNVPVSVIAHCPQGINGLSARMIVANSSNGQLAGYDGTTFTNNIADADTAARTSIRLTKITAGAIWTRAYSLTGTWLVLGGTPHSSIASAFNIGDVEDASWTSSPLQNWNGQASYGTSGQVTAIVPVYGASDSADLLLWAEADLSAVKSIVKRIERSSGSVVYAIVQELTDDAILSGVAVGTTVYFATSRGRIYSYDATNAQNGLVLLGTDISPSSANLYGLTAWNDALWVAGRDGTKLLIRRYGPGDANDPASPLAWSDPIYGGTIDASATAARELLPFGGYLYAATEASGAAKAYRVDADLVNTAAVTLESVLYDGGLGDIPKIARRITVRHSALLSGESVQVQYRLEDSGDWISLGTNSTVDSIQTSLRFPSLPTWLQIAVRIVLTAASSASSPQVTFFNIDAGPAPVARREWRLKVQMRGISGFAEPTLTGSESLTGLQIDAKFWEMLEAGRAVRLLDIDGQVYDVQLDGYDPTAQQDGPPTGWPLTADLTLLEVA